MKKKEIEDDEERNIPLKKANQSEKNSKDIAETGSEQSQE